MIQQLHAIYGMQQKSPRRQILLLYSKCQSSVFLLVNWTKANHVRVKKLGCFPRSSARGKQYVIDGEITEKIRAPSREYATFGRS